MDSQSKQVVLKCQVSYKTLILTEYADIYKQSQDVVIEFTFASSWDGLNKIAVINDTAYELAEDKLLIASELITDTIKLSLYSTGTKTLVTNELEIEVKEIGTTTECESTLSLEDIEKIVTQVNEKTQEVFVEVNNKLAEIIELIHAIDCSEKSEPVDEDPVVEDVSIITGDSAFAGLKTASELVNAITVGWNLAGTLEAVGWQDADQETSWGMPKATKELFDTVKQKGFNAVRLPVTWSQHIDWTTTTIAASWLDRVEEVVNYVLDNDMICILNTHHDHSSYMHANSNFRQWAVLDESLNSTVCSNLNLIWNQIATRFNKYDGRLIFEAWNEIQHTEQNWVAATDGEWNSLNTMAKTFVDTIRATGGNNQTRCLLINPPMTSDKNIDKMIIPEDVVADRILISGHPYDSRYGEELEDRFPGWDSMIAKGIPVLFGEVGTTASIDLETRERNALNYTARAKQHGIPLFWWDDQERLLLNRSNNTWEYETIVDNLILGANSNPEDIIYTAVHKLNDLSYWESGRIDPDTGLKVEGKYNSKVLKENLATSEGHVEYISVTSHDNGFQLWSIAFYDAEGAYVYGIYKPSMYNVSFVCPPNAVSFNITIWNPWGSRSDSQLTAYFANEQLSVVVKEEETTREWEDERLHVYDFDTVDLSDIANWRIGQYAMGGSYTKSLTSRICVKGLLKVNANELLENIITNADGTTNSDVKLVLRTYDANNDLVENVGAWTQGVVYSNGNYGVELGLTLYFPDNGSAVFSDYQALFESGLNITMNQYADFSQYVISGSDCQKAKSVSNTGELVTNGEKYRALPLLDVSKAERELAVMVLQNTWRFCEYDENMNVLRYQETAEKNKITMLDNTKYIRISGSNIVATTSVKVAYKGELTLAE